MVKRFGETLVPTTNSAEDNNAAHTERCWRPTCPETHFSSISFLSLVQLTYKTYLRLQDQPTSLQDEIKMISLSSFNYEFRTPLLLFYLWHGSKGNSVQCENSTLKPTLMRTEEDFPSS